MSSIKITQIDGDVSVGRNVAIGGRFTSQGSAHIKQDLRVDGWIIADDIQSTNKGLFQSVESLNEAHPKPQDGWWAIVGTALPAPIYVAENGTWVATGEMGGNPTIESEQVNASIEELQSDVSEINNNISDLNDLKANIGKPNGIAPLGADGKLPDSLLPDSANEVIEFSTMDDADWIMEDYTDKSSTDVGVYIIYNTKRNVFLLQSSVMESAQQPSIPSIKMVAYKNWADSKAFGEITDKGVQPSQGKLYIDASQNLTFRWNGFSLVQVGSKVNLGYTEEDAFPGNEGKTIQENIVQLEVDVNKVKGIDSSKYGHSRVTADNILQFFASAEAQELYDDDPESNAHLLLGFTPIATTSGGDGEMVNVKVQNNLPTRILYASTGEKCNIDFTFISQIKDGGNFVDSGERGRVEISVRSENADTYVVKSQFWTNSNQSTKVDVAPYLETGANSVMVKITGEQTEKTAIALVYTIQLTSLSLADSGFAWWQAYTNDFIIPLRIGGNITKILNVRIYNNDGYSEEYHINLYNNIYLETAYNYKMIHPTTSGVYTIEMYVSNADGQLKTSTLTYNVMCIQEGETKTLMVVNNKLATPSNWAQNTFVEYAVYNGGEDTAPLQATITKDGNIIYDASLTINTQQRYQLTTTLEVETLDDAPFPIKLELYTMGIYEGVDFIVDNSLGYSAVSGAELYINPKKRTNEQLNREAIINEVDGSQISAQWNGFNWLADGWVDADFGRALRVTSGNSVALDWMPFATEVANIGKTIEIDFKANNVIDGQEPIITIASSGDNYVGLKISPEDITMMTTALKDEVNQTAPTNPDDLIHMMLSIMPDTYGNDGFNLCIIYINGVKNREFLYASNDYFRQTGQLVIGSTSADVDIYGVRSYPTAITADGAMQNFINWLADNEMKNIVKSKNNVYSADGSSIDYAKCVPLFNCFEFDKDFPSYVNDNTMTGTIKYTFKNQPDDYITIEYAPADGQGTTSKKYWVWNVRWKLGDQSKTTYADGTTDTGKVKLFATQPPIQRITAKKNFASPMHSHKMGSVNSITDLFAMMGFANEANARISTYQEPFVGFQKVVGDDGSISHQFMGLYTLGADKGDKNTFGYDKKAFPNYFAIEGSDNAPLLTLFRVPYNPNKNYVTYSPSEEALQYNGANSWDYNSGAADSGVASESKAKFDAQWAEPYNFVYTCSPRLKPFFGTIDELNAQLATYKNQPYEFWCLDYNVYYYEVAEGKFIPSDIGNGTINLKTQLCGKGYGLEESQLSGSTEQQNQLFINARVQKFKLEVSNYFDIDDALFGDIWVEFNAGTDNRAKNTYPYIFGLLADGFRWRWRHDDTDTIFDITNQGQSLKPYYVEVGDAYANGQPVWNGETNNFFNLLAMAFADRKAELARRYMDAMASLSGLEKGTSYEKLMAFYEKYYWSNAQEYFAQALYNADTKFSHETAKLAQIEGRYSNDTDPLTQALGDHYSAEKRWVSQRIIYMMSKYSWGMFSAGNTDGTISVRASGDSITYNLTPSMWLYPAIANGTTIIRGERTEVGEQHTMTVELGGASDQQNNIMGANYLLDIGEWHDKRVSGTMTISGKMLRNISLGHENADEIVISISSLVLGSTPMLESLKLSNIGTLSGIVDLRNARRIREVYADGTSITQIKLSSGSDLTTLSYGSANQYIVLSNQKQLTSVDYSRCKESVTTFAVSDCPNINGVQMLLDIYNRQKEAGNVSMTRIRLSGINLTNAPSSMLDVLAELADGTKFSGVDVNGDPIEGSLPILSGRIEIDGYAYEDSVNVLREAFPSLEIVVSGYYVRFEDAEFLRVLLSKGIGDGIGITREQAEAVTSIGTYFQNNTTLVSANDLAKLVRVTTLNLNAFSGCTNLEDVDLVNINEMQNSIFKGDTSLRMVKNANKITKITTECFSDCSSLTWDGIKSFTLATIVDSYAFKNCTNLGHFDFKSIVDVGYQSIQNCGITSLENVDKIKTTQNYGLYLNPIDMDEVNLDSIVSIGGNTFNSTSPQVSVGRYILGSNFTFSGLYSLNSTRMQCELIMRPLNGTAELGSSCKFTRLTKVVLAEGLTKIGDSGYNGCICPIVIPSTVQEIGRSFDAPYGVEGYENYQIYIKATTPPTLTYNSMGDGRKNIYIPKGTLATYQAATTWANLKNKLVEYDFDEDPDNINQYCV
jgi:hypothetical protein